MKEYTIETLAAQLKDNKKENKKAVLFLGAGVSASAGIPLASEIMKEIEEDDNLKVIVRDAEKNYGGYFAELNQGQAKRIFKKHIDNSKINLAHLYACHLVKDEYIDCILTTNFDPLVIRTLSIYDIQPTIYDLTVTRDNISSDLSYPAVVYLHGQNNGFWRLNTNSEFDIAKETIGKTLSKVIMGRPIIIVGYSGNNDPVFDQLSKIDSFADSLYWVTYKDHDPGEHVQEKLLNKHSKGAYCIKGYDADQFFRNLSNNLTKKVPDILNKPFTHLKGLIDNIAEIKLDNDKPWEALVQVKENIEAAINDYEGEPKTSKLTIGELSQLVNEIWLSGDYEKLNELDEDNINKIIASNSIELKKVASSVYNDWGVDIGNLAKTKTGLEQGKLYISAIEKFEIAIAIKPNYDVYYNWGTYLGKCADTKDGDEQELFYNSALEKFEKAVSLKSDFHEAYYNWGIALGKLANKKTGSEKERLYSSAFEKFEKAIAINSDFQEALNNWGVYLGKFAKMKIGKEREKLNKLAIEKYKEAITIKPDDHDVYYNWACLYAMQNKIDESIEYLKKAISLNKEGTYTKSFILNDEDFQDIKNDPKFIAFLKETFTK